MSRYNPEILLARSQNDFDRFTGVNVFYGVGESANALAEASTTRDFLGDLLQNAADIGVKFANKELDLNDEEIAELRAQLAAQQMMLDRQTQQVNSLPAITVEAAKAAAQDPMTKWLAGGALALGGVLAYSMLTRKKR